MFVSFDDGEHWQSFQLNLPHTPITDLRVHNGDLVLSTQGRSFWVLDDLSPLHQLDEQVKEGGNHLFAPRTAYRTQFRGYAGNPGPDPYPTGALLYFYLDEESAGEKIDLDILSESGDTVRSFSTDSVDVRDRNRIKVSKGLNRFEWDLNHEGPFTVDNLVTMVIGNPPRGPEAVPGTYSAHLKIGQKEYEQAFQLKADPRWEASTEDLSQTHELASEIAEMINNFQHAIEQARSIREQIKSIAEKVTKSQEIQEQAQKISQQLTELEDSLINNNIESGQDPIGMERRLSNRMGRLYQVVRGHDAKPTAGMEERLNDLEKVYQKQMDMYRQIVEEDISSFNKLLENENVKHVLISDTNR